MERSSHVFFCWVRSNSLPPRCSVLEGATLEHVGHDAHYAPPPPYEVESGHRAFSGLCEMTALAKFAPPAVQYPFARSAVLGWVCALLWAVSAVGLVAFTRNSGLEANSFPVVAGFAIGSWAIASLCSLAYWWRSPQGHLVWDGRRWSMRLDKAVVDIPVHRAPVVLFDMQTKLWVTLSGEGQRPLWLWLESSRQPERWGDLRRAVYSPAMQAAAPASPSTPATGREP